MFTAYLFRVISGTGVLILMGILMAVNWILLVIIVALKKTWRSASLKKFIKRTAVNYYICIMS